MTHNTIITHLSLKVGRAYLVGQLYHFIHIQYKLLFFRARGKCVEYRSLGGIQTARIYSNLPYSGDTACVEDHVSGKGKFAFVTFGRLHLECRSVLRPSVSVAR